MKCANIRRKSMRGLLAAAFTLGAVFSAPAAIYWTAGANSSKWGTAGNWSGKDGRTYFFKSQNPKRDFMYLDKDYIGAIVWPSGGSSYYHGLCFGENPDSGPWGMHGTVNGKTYTYDNSGGSAYDSGIICVGYIGQSSAARFYAVNLKCRNFTIGGDTTYGGGDILKRDMTGYVVLDDLGNGATSYLAPVSLTATSTFDCYKGCLYATNATITSSGNMTLYNFVLEKTGGNWTLNGDLVLGAKADCDAVFTMNSGTTTVSTAKWTKSTYGNGILNLNGGTFVTRHIEDNAAGGSMTVNFNGGTLKANDAYETGLIHHNTGDGTFVNVDEGGCTIDTGVFDVTISVPVNAIENTSGPFTVTGGGSATFSETGNLSGAFTIGEDTALKWFDQDGVVSNYTFSSLNIAPGATLYINADATGCDTFSVTTTNITATVENPAVIKLVLTSLPSPTAKFPLFEIDDPGKITVVAETSAGATLDLEKTYENGKIYYSINAREYTWNGGASGASWSADDKWLVGGTPATWADNNIAVFAIDGDSVSIESDVTAIKFDFRNDATVLAGGGTLTVPSVSVAADVSATVAAPVSGALEKSGAGTLTLGTNRTEQTTLSEGTLVLAGGATVDPSKLTLGTDAAKPVVFDYGGQTLTSGSTDYLAADMNITLTNGVYSFPNEVIFTKATFPARLTVAKGATLQTSDRFQWDLASDVVLDITGGALKSIANNNNWLLYNSQTGRLDINVSDGGLLEFGGETYMLTCHGGTDDYQSPELHLMLTDSTLRVKNGSSLCFGRHESTRASATPVFTLSATNSVFDVPYGINLGNYKTGLSKNGSYTADFEDCIITTRYFRVYNDRTLNNAAFNGSSIVFRNTGAMDASDDDSKWFTVGGKGLTLDTNGKDVSLNANLGGSGAVTKTGAGKLAVNKNQTVAAALNVNEGTLAIKAGVSLARATTVADGAALTVNGTEQVTVDTLSLAAGSTLNIVYASGVVPLSVSTLTLPESGTATLALNGAAFPVGTYKILEKSGIAVTEDLNKLVPSTGNETYGYSVTGDTLILTVGTPAHGRWRAGAGSGDFANPWNWEDGQVPVAGDALDFSGVTANMTLNCSDLGETAFGAVTMGSGVITFNGSLTATSFSDTSKIAVGAGSTVTLDGDLVFESGGRYIAYRVDEGGAFVVTGKVRASGTAEVFPYYQTSAGYIVAAGLENAQTTAWNFRLSKDKETARWVVGKEGILGSRHFWSFNNNLCGSTITADSDFHIKATLSSGTSRGKGITFDTAGWSDPTTNYTVTADAPLVGIKPLTITGGGTFLCNYVPVKVDSYAAFSGAITVKDTATLAINAGKYPTTGSITIDGGATLMVTESGTVTHPGALTLADGATLSFNFTERSNPPVLATTASAGLTHVGRRSSTMRVASYNIKCSSTGDDASVSWDARMTNLVDLVKDIAPDVIGFQEVRSGQYDDLKAELSGYTFVGAMRDASNSSEATPVAFLKSRFELVESGTFWLSATPEVQGSTSWGPDAVASGHPRICSWTLLKDRASGDVFCFASTHLDLNAAPRLASINLINSYFAEHLAPDVPVIVTGDMNALETEESMLTATNTFNDAFIVSKTAPTGPWRTFNGYVWNNEEVSAATALANYSAAERTANVSTLGKRIDYIFTSPTVEVETFTTRNDPRTEIEAYPSDHYPVVADIRVPNAGKMRVEISSRVSRVTPRRYALTSGAKLQADDTVEFVVPDWVAKAAVEDGEIVIYPKPETFVLIVR